MRLSSHSITNTIIVKTTQTLSLCIQQHETVKIISCLVLSNWPFQLKATPSYGWFSVYGPRRVPFLGSLYTLTSAIFHPYRFDRMREVLFFSSLAFVRLLFESDVYFFVKLAGINDSWIRYIQMTTVRRYQ